MYAYAASSKYQVKYWHKQLQWDRESVDGNLSHGRPVECSGNALETEDLALQGTHMNVL
jgi:hypothetical protein